MYEVKNVLPRTGRLCLSALQELGQVDIYTQPEKTMREATKKKLDYNSLHKLYQCSRNQETVIKLFIVLTFDFPFNCPTTRTC